MRVVALFFGLCHLVQGTNASLRGSISGRGQIVTTTTSTTIVHVTFPSDEAIPPNASLTYAVFMKLPLDTTYQVTKFGWRNSSVDGWTMAMMFTISDHAVDELQKAYPDKNFSDQAPVVLGGEGMDALNALTIAQWSGGYLLMQQAESPMPVIPDKWGMLAGKNTSRVNVLVRWGYDTSRATETQFESDSGFDIYLTTNEALQTTMVNPDRPMNFGEAKFAIAESFPVDDTSIQIPPGEFAWPINLQCTTQGTKDVFRGDGVKLLQIKPFGNWLSGVRILESSGGGSFKDPNYQKYEACRFPFYANYLQEDGDWKEIWASSSIGEFQNVTSDVYIRPGNSYRVECIFNTSNSSVWVTAGSDPMAACQVHFYYHEIPGENEPYPGFCMDYGPWFMRSPRLPQEEANAKMQKWWSNPLNRKEYACPSSNAQYEEELASR